LLWQTSPKEVEIGLPLLLRVPSSKIIGRIRSEGSLLLSPLR
jgi:hypothetical protein